MSTDLNAASIASSRLQAAFTETPPVFELLRTVRNRRIAQGWPIDAGSELVHPITGRAMRQEAGPLRHEPPNAPAPLTELEEALLCWAACGPNGQVVWDLLFAGGFNQLADLAGRTSPTPHNTGTTELLVINDDGVHLYRPAPDRTSVLALDGHGEGAFDDVLRWYREGRIEVLDHRPDFDWAMWQPGAPNTPLSGAANFNLNRPGSTWLLPVADAGRLMFTLLDLFATGHKYLVDEFNGDRPAGLEPWIAPGKLELGIPISAQEQTLLQAETYPAGALTQNVRLAAEALGLGCWTVSGYNRDVLLGINPQISAGLGFQWAAPNPRAPVATGRMKCFGIPGVKEATFVPSPRFADGRAIVEHWREERFGTGGWADPSRHGLLRRGESAFTAEVVDAILAHPLASYPDWVWDAAVAYIDYCVEHFGQWPVTYNPMQAHWGPVVHHLDVVFYDRYYRSGVVNNRIRRHAARWD